MGLGIKRILNGVAGALTLHGLIQPTLVPRCFFYNGHLTRLALWVMGKCNIGQDDLRSAISFRWWLSLLAGIGGFVVNLLLKSP